MPYIFIEDDAYDEESMGAPADVVERDEFSRVEEERDQYRNDRDAAVKRADELDAELRDTKDRYARHIITAAEIQKRTERDTRKDGRPQSFKELFEMRTSD